MSRWKEKIEQRLDALERAQQPQGQADSGTATISAMISADTASSAHSNIPGPRHPIHAEAVPLVEANDATLNLASNLGIFPAASVGAGTPRDIALPTSDVVSRGVISLADAEQCLAYFLEHLNRYMHGILSDDVTLADLRARSPILTAAVCTVASSCSASDTYQSCHDAFVGQVSGMLFATRSSYDDVRALCIAALWLDDIGPTLSGLGKSVRHYSICTELC